MRSVPAGEQRGDREAPHHNTGAASHGAAGGEPDELTATPSGARFLANLAHQLRSPLSSLRVWVDLLGDPAAQASPESMKRLIEGIERATSRLERQITDVLEAGYLEAGTLTFEKSPVDAVQQLVLAVADTDHMARSRNVGIDLNTGEQPVTVVAADSRLRQIFGTFLSNAIKFSPVGGTVAVTVSASPVIAEDPASTVILEPAFDGAAYYFCISTDGPGLDRSLHRDIFRPIHRSAHSSARSAGGSGLGLAIAAGLIRLMQGGTWLRSGTDSGVQFEFSLMKAGGKSPRVTRPDGESI